MEKLSFRANIRILKYLSDNSKRDIRHASILQIF